MYRALYRKWRPRSFDDVCGQEQVTDILKYQISENRISHAYLFCGSRGTGKTSCAKILAKAVNCLSPVNGNPCNECEACRSIDAGTATDVIEMDAASNNGVDNVRDMKEDLVFTPAELRYRVYIIDEVHMMSGSAFNALLKTLEEPPSYVLFVLATTELAKLPATIVSRCQRYDFRRLTSDTIIARLRRISEAEGIRLEESGARLIAKMAQGGMRDAISLLELCAGMNEPIGEALAARVLGVGGRETPSRIVDAVVNRDYQQIYRLVAEMVSSSQDLSVFWSELIEYYRDLIVVKTLGDAREYLDLTESEQKSLSELAIRIPMAKLLYHSKLLEETSESLRRAGAGKRSIAELALVRMCEPKLLATPESMLARIEDLEKQVARMIASGGASSLPVQEKETNAEEKIGQNEKAKPEQPKQVKKTEKPPAAVGEVRQIASWGAVLEELAELKPSLKPFLKGSAATVDPSGAVTVRLTVKLFFDMVDRDAEAKTMMANLLKARGETVTSLHLAAGEKKPTDDSPQFEF